LYSYMAFLKRARTFGTPSTCISQVAGRSIVVPPKKKRKSLE
jgi:hypothetical protein